LFENELQALLQYNGNVSYLDGDTGDPEETVPSFGVLWMYGVLLQVLAHPKIVRP
jgi:hypothetical protein